MGGLAKHRLPTDSRGLGYNETLLAEKIAKMKFLPVVTLTCTTPLVLSLASPTIAQEAPSFQTPSGNIYCVVQDLGDRTSQLRCDLLENTAQLPKKPKDCDLDWGNVFIMSATGAAQRACHGDTAINPNYPVLRYGQPFQAQDYTCTAQTTGLTCTNAQGRGWDLSKARQRLF